MPEVAWTLLTRHNADAVLRVAPVTLVRAGLVGHEDATRVLMRDALDDPTWSPSPDEVLAIARLLLACWRAAEPREAVLTRFRDDLKRDRPRRYEALDGWLREGAGRVLARLRCRRRVIRALGLPGPRRGEVTAERRTLRRLTLHGRGTESPCREPALH